MEDAEVRTAHVAKPSSFFDAVAPTEAPTLIGLTKTTSDTEALTSVSVLDGDHLQLTFDNSVSDHTVELRYQQSSVGSHHVYKFFPTIRAMTGGSYNVKIFLWDWQGPGYIEWSGTNPITFGNDFKTVVTGAFSTYAAIVNNNAIDIKMKMVFTATMTTATPAIQIEKAGWARYD